MMKWRLIIIVSVALNVAFVLGILSQHPDLFRRQTVTDQRSLAPAAPALNPVVQPPENVAAPKFPPFHWSDIASDDLKIYRDRLYAVGCPGFTTREIIKGEINERFSARRRAILTGWQGKFWELLACGGWVGRQQVPRTDWGQALQTLAEERKKLIQDVLGATPAASDAGSLAQRRDLERRFSWLPAEKRDRLIALEEQFQRRMLEWAESVASGPANSPAETEARLQTLQQTFEKTKQQLLTTEELEELRLRESDAANWAAGLAGYEPTEDEWRSVARLKLNAEAAECELAGESPTDEERAARQQELEAKLTQNIREALGEERFAQYELATDGRFQAVRSIVERYGLPDQLAAQICQVQRDAQARAAQLSADQNLSPETRQSALAAIRLESERTLKEMLGEKAFSDYTGLNGDWLQEMVPGPQN